jgi:peptidylprolyl isomerase
MAEPGDRVRVHYTGRFPDGTVFDSSEGRDPLEFEVGSGEIIPGLDKAVLAMSEGQTETVTIEPAEAYGQREEALVHEIDRSQLPEGATEGAALEAQVNGQKAILWITEIGESTATVDANHPLAGKTLVFDVEVVEVQAA